jgi:hypothetical protein
VKTQFTLEDIKDKVKLRKDIEDTYQRLKNSKTRRKNRTDEDIYKRTYIGLPLEHYLMQENPKFIKAIERLNENKNHLYHDLIDTETGEIHECKVTEDQRGWDGYQIQKQLLRISHASFNESTVMHLAVFKDGVYHYKGYKKINRQ